MGPFERLAARRSRRSDDQDAPRLSRSAGLAVFDPDAISNTAFAAETLLRVHVGVLASLWAVPLLLTFTLSQFGMSAHHARERRERRDGSRVRVAVNAVGGTATMVSLGVLMATTLRQGAWLLAVVVPVMVRMISAFSRYYGRANPAATTERRAEG